MSVLPLIQLRAFVKSACYRIVYNVMAATGCTYIQTFPQTVSEVFIGSNALRLIIWNMGTGLRYRA
jgi:hypothetical protein